MNVREAELGGIHLAVDKVRASRKELAKRQNRYLYKYLDMKVGDHVTIPPEAITHVGKTGFIEWLKMSDCKDAVTVNVRVLRKTKKELLQFTPPRHAHWERPI